MVDCETEHGIGIIQILKYFIRCFMLEGRHIFIKTHMVNDVDDDGINYIINIRYFEIVDMGAYPGNGIIEDRRTIFMHFTYQHDLS